MSACRYVVPGEARGIRSSAGGVKDSCDLYQCWELTLGPLEEWPSILMAETSPQTHKLTILYGRNTFIIHFKE